MTFSFLDGGASETTDALSPIPDNYHDIIKLSIKSKERIFEICQPLYEKGYSLREIERQTGIPKTSISDALRKENYVLRRYTERQQSKEEKPSGMKAGVIPYGYAYLEGELVKDPTEYKVVLKIIRLWESGKSFRGIADILNQKNIPTRTGTRWVHSVVRTIIKRAK